MKVLNIIVFHLTRAFHPPVFRKKNWITHIICRAFTKNKTLFSPKLPGNFFGIFLQFVRIFLLELFWNISRTKCSSGLTSQEENIEQHWRWVGCVTFFCQKKYAQSNGVLIVMFWATHVKHSCSNKSMRLVRSEFDWLHSAKYNRFLDEVVREFRFWRNERTKAQFNEICLPKQPP